MILPPSARFLKILIIISGLIGLFLFSEILYIFKTESHLISAYYLTHLSADAPSGFLSNVRNRISSIAVYHYLNRATIVFSDKKSCVPFCLEYDMGENIISHFKYLEKSGAISTLNSAKQAQLYFWLATINIRHDDDKTTLGWLKNASRLDQSKREYKSFYDDLDKLNQIIKNPESKSYFLDKLANVNSPRVYESLYLAKAANLLANDFLASGDVSGAKIYFEKASILNPWNLDYYISLSKVFESEGNLGDTAKILEKCINAIPESSGVCKWELDRLSPL